MHFVNENVCILNKISLKFVPKGPIDNDQAIFRSNAHPIHWRIYAALGEGELMHFLPLCAYGGQRD